MIPILTVTLNPAVDISTYADEVRPGPKLRCDPPIVDPGGGGINVSRAIAILGGQSVPFVAVGGSMGARLMALLEGEGLAPLAFLGAGETRQSLAVTDRGTGEQYRFVLPGPIWSAAQIDRVLETIAKSVEKGSLVVLSGSQPPGVPVEFPAQLAAVVVAAGGRLIVDTSGAPLAHLATAPGVPLYVLRADGAEADELAGRALLTASDAADFAQELARKGVAEIVIFARGADGAVAATSEQRMTCSNAKVPVVSKVGAGDSFVGALVLALAQEEPLGEAMRRGNAAASAAVATEATRLCTREMAEGVLPACQVTLL